LFEGKSLAKMAHKPKRGPRYSAIISENHIIINKIISACYSKKPDSIKISGS